MPDFEERFRSFEDARREIEDSLVVIAHLEARQSKLIKEQQAYIARHELRLRQAEERDKDVDERIEKLVSAIGVMISKPH